MEREILKFAVCFFALCLLHRVGSEKRRVSRPSVRREMTENEFWRAWEGVRA